MSASYLNCNLALSDETLLYKCYREASISIVLFVPTQSELERACQVPSCRNVIEVLETRYPAECVLTASQSSRDPNFLLYKGLVNQFEAICGTSSSASSTSGDVGSESGSSGSKDDSDAMVGTPLPTTQPADTGDNVSTGSSMSSLSIGAVVTVGVIAIVLVVIWWRRHRRRTQAADSYKRHEDIDSHAPAGPLTTASSDGTNAAVTAVESMPDQLINDMTSLLRDRTLHDHRVDATGIQTLEILGRGSHGIVFLVQLQQSMFLASKRLNPIHTTQQQLQRLIDEVKAASALKHASIVEFVGVAWTNETDLQVLYEYMAGGDLRSYLQSTSPSSTESFSLANASSMWSPLKLQIALHIIEGLVYTHSFYPPLVHRDLKSRNVLLTEASRAKISDFGVSRYQSEVGTMTTGVGSSRWMAPEVITGGGEYTESSDIYSFGVILTELDTHAVPYEDAIAQNGEGVATMSELSLMQRVGRGELRPTVSESCPSVIAVLASECLQFEPSSRPNALEIAYRLRLLGREVRSES